MRRTIKLEVMLHKKTEVDIMLVLNLIVLSFLGAVLVRGGKLAINTLRH